MSTLHSFAFGSIVAALLAWSQVAVADDSADPEPWYQGVSRGNQQEANALFEEAVLLHKQLLLADAVALYQQALERWEHPLIRFHLGRAQEKLGDLVAAYDNLRQALRWGIAPFTPEEASMAHETLQRLEAALVRLEVDCNEPNAQVILDGKAWFVCPGRAQVMLQAGEHAIIARKPGYFTVTRSISLVPNRHATAEIRLTPRTLLRGRWNQWGRGKTWALVGTSAALAIAGGAFEWLAIQNIELHNQRLQVVCGDAPTCEPYRQDSDLREMRDDVRREHRLAIGAFAAAGVALAAGGLLTWLDRPSHHRNDDEGTVELTVTPLVTQSGAGMWLKASF